MDIGSQQENWQVKVGGQIYSAASSELPEWINEGSLQRGDKVRKGKLRWIEAGKVPALVPFFNAKEKGEHPPLIRSLVQAKTVTVISFGNSLNPAETALTAGAESPQISPHPSQAFENQLHPPPSASDVDTCSLHPGVPSYYICSSCAAAFCKACPRSFGSEVKICPSCDSLCRSINDVAEADKRFSTEAAHIAEGFGSSDFFYGLAYPLKFKPSFIFGALMFMFFTFGQSASASGGIFMLTASLFCVLLSNMLTFGILANTVDNFTNGQLDADFMPSFDYFSIWESVIYPFFLSIGAYLSAFGPLFLAGIIGIYMITASVSEQREKFEAELAAVPGTQFYGPDRTAEQSQEVRDVLAKVKEQNTRQIERQTQTANGEPPAAADGDSHELQVLIEQTQASQIGPAPAKNPAAPEEQSSQMLSGILRLPAPLVVIGAITLLWGIFYFPAACAGAAYSRSFMAAVNPLVGIDTIRRLGFSYVKVLVMGLCILIVWAMATGILSVLFSPLDLPQFGNLPAAIVGSVFTFYFWIVFSCILSLALYKAGDRLKGRR